MTQTKFATVTKTVDLSKKGIFQAQLDYNKESIQVIYVTPFASHPVNSNYYRYTGFTAIPTLGTRILVNKFEEGNYWYYAGAPTYKEGDGFLNVPGGTAGGSAAVNLFERILLSSRLDKLISSPENFGVYSHNMYPEKYGLQSPEGGQVVISDSHNRKQRELYTALISKTQKKIGAYDSEGTMLMKNEHGDGIQITSEYYKGVHGVRSTRMECDGNLVNKSHNGEMLHKVCSGGRRLQIVNEAEKDYNKGNVSTDNDVGSVNILSKHNDVTIKVTEKRVDEGRRIFIDASESTGLISIKAGGGGVEIFGAGPIDINTTGDFNVNAGGNINMKGNNIHLNPNFDFGKTQPTKDNQEEAEDSI